MVFPGGLTIIGIRFFTIVGTFTDYGRWVAEQFGNPPDKIGVDRRDAKLTYTRYRRRNNSRLGEHGPTPFAGLSDLFEDQ
jgi:hypothetical protein